jgi:alpha-ketoglutarate-dependent taurine dioxygenase
VQIDRAHLCDDDVVETVRTALEERCVLVFPQINVSDEEQLAFTDRLGGRINFTRGTQVPGSDLSAPDVLMITLDKKINAEPDYVLGTFFWHIDGVSADTQVLKATVLSARKIAETGGETEFANLYAAYDNLPEEEKGKLQGLRVIHSVEASLRPVYGVPPQERIERWRGIARPMEQPLVWTHADGRKSLLVGSHADSIVGCPGPHGRALLWRMQEWAAQPNFVYRHKWQVGDLVIFNNEGLMHRVLPYTDPRRVMHRTSIGGTEKPGHVASEERAAVAHPWQGRADAPQV